MISLVFIRHGATKGNHEKRYIGRTDEPLCDEGLEQARKLKALGISGDYVFVSPMKRAKQTAEIVFPEADVVGVDDFRETDFGIFEGKTAEELSDSKEYKIWLDSACQSPIPKGESITEFKTRCTQAFEKIIKNLPDNKKAVFVVHGGVIMAILEFFAGGRFYDYHIKNGEFLNCRFENGKIRIISC